MKYSIRAIIGVISTIFIPFIFSCQAPTSPSTQAPTVGTTTNTLVRLKAIIPLDTNTPDCPGTSPTKDIIRVETTVSYLRGEKITPSVRLECHAGPCTCDTTARFSPVLIHRQIFNQATGTLLAEDTRRSALNWKKSIPANASSTCEPYVVASTNARILSWEFWYGPGIAMGKAPSGKPQFLLLNYFSGIGDPGGDFDVPIEGKLQWDAKEQKYALISADINGFLRRNSTEISTCGLSWKLYPGDPSKIISTPALACGAVGLSTAEL